MNAQVTFQTSLFKPVPGEDEKTNPGRFGLALAEWLKPQLESRGVAVEDLRRRWGPRVRLANGAA